MPMTSMYLATTAPCPFLPNPMLIAIFLSR
jgi:hypothetical protein